MLPEVYLAFLAFVFGLLTGSFLNVVIHRVPLGESIVYPGSHCPHCNSPVRPRDNIPVLSFVLLRGRCRDCGARISRLYPVVELITGVVFLLLFLKDGIGWVVVAEMWFAATMIILMFIDARHQLLPDTITIPSVLVALVGVTALGWTGQVRRWPLEIPWLDSELGETHQWIVALAGFVVLAGIVPLLRALNLLDSVLFGKYLEWDEADDTEASLAPSHMKAVILAGVLAGIGWAILALVSNRSDPRLSLAISGLARGAVGALAGGVVLWVIRAIYFYVRGIEGMGLGDVKLMALIGAFLSWQGAWRALLIGVVLALLGGLALASRSRRGLKTAVPLGLFLAIASLVVLFTGESIEVWYWG
jgi:prepilin signal peptidase PulO-like enzyme (type II secretory pathway)